MNYAKGGQDWILGRNGAYDVLKSQCNGACAPGALSAIVVVACATRARPAAAPPRTPQWLPRLHPRPRRLSSSAPRPRAPRPARVSSPLRLTDSPFPESASTGTNQSPLNIVDVAHGHHGEEFTGPGSEFNAHYDETLAPINVHYTAQTSWSVVVRF